MDHDVINSPLGLSLLGGKGRLEWGSSNAYRYP
jgi:hypothetical protein